MGLIFVITVAASIIGHLGWEGHNGFLSFVPVPTETREDRRSFPVTAAADLGVMGRDIGRPYLTLTPRDGGLSRDESIIITWWIKARQISETPVNRLRGAHPIF